MWKKSLRSRVRSISARMLACLRHANATPASTVLHLIRVVVVVAVLTIPVLSLWCAAAESPSAPISRRGIHNGAPYRIEVPAGWNGKLVVFAHGYEGEGS